MDLRRQISIIRGWFPLLVICAVLAAAVAYGVSGLLPKSYEAKATLIVGQSLSAVNPDYNQLLVSQRLSTTYAAIATKRPMLAAVIGQLGLDVTPDELAQRVHAQAPMDSTLLTITAQDPDPASAAAIANAVAEQLIIATPAIQGRAAAFQDSIDADLKATQEQIDATQAQVDALTRLPERTARQDADLLSLEGRLATLRSTYATLLTFSSDSAANLLSVIEPAVPPLEPVFPRPMLNTILAAFLGLLVALAIAFGSEYLDDSVKDPETVRQVTDLPTLGTIARMRGRGRSEIYRVATLTDPRSSVAEAYRTLRANVEFASVDTRIRTLLVTSAVPGEGKTVTASNLAVVFAQAGRRVLLIDADLRKPGIHLLFNVPNAHGFTTLLRSDEVGLESLAHTTEQAVLRVLTTGPLPPNPAELMGSQRMRTVLDRLKETADLIVIDSPPLQAVTDAAILSSFVDGTVLVIDAGRSRRRAVRAARDVLARAGANVLGVALNRVPGQGDTSYAGYYGGVYGPGRDDKRQPQALATEVPAEPGGPAPGQRRPG